MRVGLMVVSVLSSAGCSLYFGEGQTGTPDAMTSVPDAPSFSDLSLACKAADGPAIKLDPSSVAKHLAGRWWICGGAAEFFGNVEFTPDQHFYMLTQTNGQFVRNLGPHTSGTYSIDTTTLPPGFTFAIHQQYLDGSGATYPLSGFIEDTPRKLRLGGGYYVGIP